MKVFAAVAVANVPNGAFSWELGPVLAVSVTFAARRTPPPAADHSRYSVSQWRARCSAPVAFNLPRSAVAVPPRSAANSSRDASDVEVESADSAPCLNSACPEPRLYFYGVWPIRSLCIFRQINFLHQIPHQPIKICY